MIGITGMSLVMAGCGARPTDVAVAKPTEVVRAELVTAQLQSINDGLEAVGTVRPEFLAVLSSKVSGRVQRVLVTEGEAVRAGQKLLEIDARELSSAVDMAQASYRVSLSGIASARTASELERRNSEARIAQAEAQVAQTEAALASSKARSELAEAGPRTQEVEQVRLAVVQAESSLSLAKRELDRVTILVDEGAMARRELDLAKNRYELAKAQRDSAVQSQLIAREGTRTQDRQAAREAVLQATAAVNQVKAALVQAKAASLQVNLRQREVAVAAAQADLAAANVSSSRVSLSYAELIAPFAGTIAARQADPGAMAGSGQPLLTIEGSSLRLEVTVPEKALGGIKRGTSLRFQLDALPDRSQVGTVDEVAMSGDAVSHTYVVKVRIPQSVPARTGMFGRLLVPGQTPSRQIVIPASATWEKDGLHYAMVVASDGTAHLRLITLGGGTNRGVIVLSGLTAGERLCLRGDHVSEGAKVEASQP